MIEPVELYRARDLMEADALVIFLAERDISARIDNESIQGGLGELPLGWMTVPRVVVAAVDEAGARDLLPEFLDASSRSSSADACLSCGSPMESSACPECGWSWHGEADGETEEKERSATTAVDAKGEDEVSPFVPVDLLPGEETTSVIGEIGVVLTVGYIPTLALVVSETWWPEIKSATYVADCFRWCCLYGVVILSTLIAMRRSSLRWHQFGLPRMSVIDLFLAFLLTGVIAAMNIMLSDFFPAPDANYADKYLLPESRVDYVWMVPTILIINVAFELLMRAYLVTRLAMLTGSRMQAVCASAALSALYSLVDGPASALHSLVASVVVCILFLGLRRIWPLMLAATAWGIYVEMWWASA